jgi:hypothetical protein
MSNALAAIAERLGKLIPRLATDQDGEVVATARAIGRTLHSARLDFHDLAQAVVTEPAPVVVYRERPAPSSEPQSWSALARWCRAQDLGRLTPREREFVADMCAKLVLDAKPTDKQANWLRSLYAKLGGGR